jgi:hypothetical protein
VPPAQPRQALPPAAQAAPGLVLLQPAAAPILGGETAARRPEPAAMPLSELPSVAALPPVTPSVPLSTPPSRLLMPPPAPSLPALSPGASLPPIFGPVGLRRD